MIVAITGGTGFIGGKVVAHHLAAGDTVCVLTRRHILSLPAGAVRFVGNLADSSFSLNELVRGADIVYNCAGELRDKSGMRALHVDGTQRLLQAVSKEFAETGRKIHWVQLSSVGAYGPIRDSANTDRIVTEGTPPYPVGEYEITKTRADELVMQACDAGTLTYSIIRPSNVFGPEMTNQSLRGLIQVVKRGLFVYVGKPGAVATYVHVDDVVAALTKCAIDPIARGRIYNLSYDCLLEELIDHIASTLSMRSPCLRIPETLTRKVVSIFEGRVNLPLTQSRIDVLVNRTRYPADRIVSELGFGFSKAMPAAINEMV
jgi:nucleoside-diphosphate-sugar epimerase